MIDKPFLIRLDHLDVEKGEILDGYNCKFKVLKTPKRKWYHLLFQFITFGLFKARREYKVKLHNFENRCLECGADMSNSSYPLICENCRIQV